MALIRDGMSEYLEWQEMAAIRYSEYCKLRRESKSKDDIDYAQERYHWAKVKMRELKDKYNLVFS